MKIVYFRQSRTPNPYHMIVSIPVAPYVWEYLHSVHGPQPYDLTAARRNYLRLRFLATGLAVDFLPFPRPLPGHYLQLDLGEDRHLIQAYKAYEPILKNGVWYQAEFMQAMRAWVRAQEQLAAAWGCGPGAWNKKMALDMFLESHGIRPESYDFFSAYRQHNRMEQAERQQLAEKLSLKYHFRPSENQHFRLARLHHGKRHMIRFSCYSRSREDIRQCAHRIPPRLLRSGQWFEYAHQAICILNSYLLRGHTVA